LGGNCYTQEKRDVVAEFMLQLAEMWLYAMQDVVKNHKDRAPSKHSSSRRYLFQGIKWGGNQRGNGDIPK
jgi:hypothetical protein